MEKVNDYIVNSDTLALVPFFNEFGECWTKAIEKYRNIQVEQAPKTIIKESCLYYGVSLRGRIESAKRVLPGHRMLPVCVSEVANLCFIPTRSMENADCQWIAHSAVKTIVSAGKRSKIILINKEEVIVEKQACLLFNKIKNASHLLFTYLQRLHELKEQETVMIFGKPYYYQQTDHELTD